MVENCGASLQACKSDRKRGEDFGGVEIVRGLVEGSLHLTDNDFIRHKQGFSPSALRLLG